MVVLVKIGSPGYTFPKYGNDRPINYFQNMVMDVRPAFPTFYNYGKRSVRKQKETTTICSGGQSYSPYLREYEFLSPTFGIFTFFTSRLPNSTILLVTATIFGVDTSQTCASSEASADLWSVR